MSLSVAQQLTSYFARIDKPALTTCRRNACADSLPLCTRHGVCGAPGRMSDKCKCLRKVNKLMLELPAKAMLTNGNNGEKQINSGTTTTTLELNATLNAL